MAEWLTVPCDTSACLAILPDPAGYVRIRSTEDPDHEVVVDVDEWRAMVAAVRGGWGDL